jgi:uncharacterized membrane protein YkgB
MTLTGIYFLFSATTKSKSLFYQALVAKSRILWRSNVYRFHQIVGVILIIIGLLWAIGVIWI